MAPTYHAIEIYTSEEARHEGRPLYQAVLEHVQGLKIAARCIVTKGVAGGYENGEIATTGLEILSFNLPVKIEIVLPTPELELVLPTLESWVTDGIVTVASREIRLHHTRFSLLPRQLRVRDVMTPAPKAVNLGATADEVFRLLLSSLFNGVPVLDTDGHPVGIVTQGDLVARAGLPMRLGLLREMEPAQVEPLLRSLARLEVRGIMTAPVVTVREEEPLLDAVETMLSRNLKRLPAVRADGALAGMLSRLDVFRAIAHKTPDWNASPAGRLEVRDARFVRDVMRRDTRVVEPATPVEAVIRLIIASGVQRIAVAEADGRFLGLISDRVLLAALTEHREGIWNLWLSRFSFSEIRKNRGFLKRFRSMTAREVMQVDLITVREETPLDAATRLMTQHAIKRLPVVDGEGKFKGMVSRDALLRAGLARPAAGR